MRRSDKPKSASSSLAIPTNMTWGNKITAVSTAPDCVVWVQFPFIPPMAMWLSGRKRGT